MSKSRRTARQKSRIKARSTPLSLPSLAAVCSTPEDLLGRLDVAALNLLCATGLPGAEHLNYRKLFDWLDDAAERVNLETRRHWYRFVASPGTYHHSPGYFCCYMLLQVLQEDFKVRYNPARAVDPTWQDHDKQPDYRDSRDLFIHGIIDGPGGTCASMPVVYLAVGRRLGYPLKLVEARAHLFLRWDDPLGLRRGLPERFNIEGSGHGIATFSDEHYRTWPEPWSEQETLAGCYLRSLTPREELAAFLVLRGMCLEDHDRRLDAIQAYEWACQLVPHDVRPRNQLRRAVGWLKQQALEINAALALQRQQREADRAASPISLVMLGHLPGCACWHCQQAHHPAPRRADHLPHCGCPDCRPTGRVPSHRAGCGCVHCRAIQRRPAYGAPGHLPYCHCSQCRPASRP